MESDSDLLKYYESLIDMFASAGWAYLVAELEEGAALETIENCKSAEHFWMAKGKSEVYRIMLGYENVINMGFEEFNAEDI